MIAGTGVRHRALACASLIDNIMRQAGLIASEGVFYQPTPGDLKLPHVAKSDIAVLAANLLLERSWEGTAEIPLLGPEDLSFIEMAEIMAEVLGRSVQFREMTMGQFEEMLLSNGVSAGMSKAYVNMFNSKNEGMDFLQGAAPRGNTPNSFRAWCETELKPAVASLLSQAQA